MQIMITHEIRNKGCSFEYVKQSQTKVHKVSKVKRASHAAANGKRSAAVRLGSCYLKLSMRSGL